MAAALKTKKPKPKSQVRIYEHTENIEAVATKEFVRQELKAEIGPVKESVNQLWKVMLWVSGGLLTVMVAGFILLLTVMTYLHGHTSKRMDRIEDKMGSMENRMDRIESKMDRMESKIDRMESKLDRLLESKGR